MTIIFVFNNSQINNNHNFNITEQFSFDSLFLYYLKYGLQVIQRKEDTETCTLLEKNIVVV